MKVLVVAGSSGGHIFPALALLDRLKSGHSGVKTLLAVPKKNIKKGTGAFGCGVSYINSVPLQAKLDSRNLLNAFKFVRGSWQSLIIILRFKPDVVVGFGSIFSIPIVILGWLMRVRVILHEQNVIPGQANRFLFEFCDRMAVSFEASRKYIRDRRNKIVFTGNPLRSRLVRADKEKCREFFVLDQNKFTILVMGGSQGSMRINRAFLKALSGFPGRDKLQIIHLSGFLDKAQLNREYSHLGVSVRIFHFLDEMEYALSLADLAVCRAGATSIHELAHYRLPAILLPYPYAYQHQSANARVLAEAGAAVAIDDCELDSDKLSVELKAILGSADRLEKMRSGYDKLKIVDGAGELAALVMDRNR